ncbi:MAG TPA: hypothetical protein VFP41_00620, partial [Actinomycetota bacterium]|nr:hypothetical protein [Actinomycetota bacterium]
MTQLGIDDYRASCGFDTLRNQLQPEMLASIHRDRIKSNTVILHAQTYETLFLPNANLDAGCL